MNIPLNCTNCQLHKTRKQVVVGRGSIPADILFIGEAPGISEDTIGLSFIGEGGKLLDYMIQEAVKNTHPVSYYITNTVLCRPPENREPEPTEVLKCRENILEIIQEVGATVFCLIGKVAERYYKDIIPYYHTIVHPAAILRMGDAGSDLISRNIKTLTEMIREVR